MTRQKPQDAAAQQRIAEELSRLVNDGLPALPDLLPRPAKRQRRPKKPPPDPYADVLRAAVPQLVFGFLTVADLLDPAGARRRQEQAEQPKPQRQKQRRARQGKPPR